MLSRKNNLKKGFTLIELLVVISIMSLLSSMIFVSTKDARVKARDAKRKEDLNQIRTALTLYRDSKGDWMETGSGCGSGGNGNAWFNYDYAEAPAPMSKCLVNGGFSSAEIIDPSGKRVGTAGTDAFAYMKYTCVQNNKKQTYLFANLESIPKNTTGTDGTCCTGCDSSFGMDYYVQITE